MSAFTEGAGVAEEGDGEESGAEAEGDGGFPSDPGEAGPPVSGVAPVAGAVAGVFGLPLPDPPPDPAVPSAQPVATSATAAAARTALRMAVERFMVCPPWKELCP
ncbi:hypothetical protein [Streptomyces omiyaensis]|uniref:Uncharacterized protein n=1 Tax=Streptomyces omiyaensis TaxID=68247 RepID=A0ABW7BME7_9ACTN